jgi:hypothetical protein
MADPYEAEGREKWEETVKRLGYGGNPDKLWDAMIAARESNGFGLSAEQLATDQSKLSVYCRAVRDFLGGPVPDQAITAGLLVMPRLCAWCENECWVWCDTCAGCVMCCTEDFHCMHHGSPFGICQCAVADYRDSDGKPPEAS